MAFYLARIKLSQQFIAALVERPEDRFVKTTKFLKSLGGRLHYYFFTFGEHDIILIYELPDNVSAASLSMVFCAAGTANEMETTPLLTMEEAIGAMRMASETVGSYQPPGHRAAARKKSASRRS